jgi:DNA-binding NtrC family response regulator
MFRNRCVVWFGGPATEERAAIEAAGWQVRIVNPINAGGMGLRRSGPLAAIADLRHDPSRMLPLIQQVIAEHPDLSWIALVSSQTAAHEPWVKRIAPDSSECFSTPIDLPHLLQALARLVESRSRSGTESADDMPALVGASTVMHALRASIRKYAPVALPVLITGETGTGKEMAAHALHQLSPRVLMPFVAINCGSLPAQLVQSELFGHERGAFTGAMARRIGHIESAAGGTVFLDEIGDLPLDAQTSLLRFLQEGTIERVGSCQPLRADVRVLAATHVDMEKAVAAGRFREDLYYRLNVLRLSIPPLHAREQDVDVLAQHFLDSFREQHRCRARKFSREASRAMRAFAWRGNVRELLNRVQRAAVVAEQPLITAADLDLPVASQREAMRSSLVDARSHAEQHTFVTCLHESRFNISECARRLSISRVTVYRLCKKYRHAVDELR